MIAARIVGAVQVSAGVRMLVAPARVARVAAGGGALAPARIVWILGLRMVVQGALTLVRSSRRALELGAGVDVVHLASMIAVTAIAPRYRRTALVSAALTAVSRGGSLGARG